MALKEILLCLSVPLTAIFLSFITKKVGWSLGAGILLGISLLIFNRDQGILHTLEHVGSVWIEPDNLKIIAFTILISLMVHVMVLRGHIETIATKLLSFARSRRSAQLMTWFMGLLIFFDDYANTLIVGNTLKPITDKYKISREKLAYIVDSTAAPVAAIALISTWIGVEVGHIETSLGERITTTPYDFFLNSLSYSYYPIFTLSFIVITIYSNREFGPMLHTKPISVTHTMVKRKTRMSFFRAIIPILVLLLFSFGGMIYTGYKNISSTHFNIVDIIGEADSINSLLLGSIVSFLVANSYKKSDLFNSEYTKTVKEALKKMGGPLLILLLAWTLGSIIKNLDTGNCIASLLPDYTTPYILPVLVFLISALVSFATGSSFSTMGIMYPIALPLISSICLANGFSTPNANEIIYHTIACVLAGAVFGDHCSPISDTTVLSSLACDCNHLNHVKTQMPYAITVAVVSMFMSLTLANTGMPALIIYGLGVLFLYLIIRIFGRTVDS